MPACAPAPQHPTAVGDMPAVAVAPHTQAATAGVSAQTKHNGPVRWLLLEAHAHRWEVTCVPIAFTRSRMVSRTTTPLHWLPMGSDAVCWRCASGTTPVHTRPVDAVGDREGRSLLSFVCSGLVCTWRAAGVCADVACGPRIQDQQRFQHGRVVAD